MLAGGASALDGGGGKDLFALGLGGGGPDFPDLPNFFFFFLSPFLSPFLMSAGFGAGGRLQWVTSYHTCSDCVFRSAIVVDEEQRICSACV